MALKIKTYLFLFFCAVHFSSSAQNKIFYTDKYDVNYFSTPNSLNTTLYFGSDIFNFLDAESLQVCTSFLDSFFVSEKINYNSTIKFNGENRFSVDIYQANAEKCDSISRIWNEKYKISFQKILLNFLDQAHFKSLNYSSKSSIYSQLILKEKNRFYNQSNSVNTVNICFVLPKNLSENEFKTVFIHYNTKRYTSSFTTIDALELIKNDSLKEGTLRYSFPSLKRHTFLKNCLSITILEELYKNIDFQLNYGINQAIGNFTINSKNLEIDTFNIQFLKPELNEAQFEQLKQTAFQKIVSNCNTNLFYYSFYDIQKLSKTIEKYSIEDFYKQIEMLNKKSNYSIAFSSASDFSYKGIKLTQTTFSELNREVQCKSNSIEFINENDTLLIDKIILFLKLNPNHKLNLEGVAKKSEYLHLDKETRNKLTQKFKEIGYTISRKKKLALWRSLATFNKLYDAGISHKRMKCSGIKGEIPAVYFELYANE